MIVYAALTPHPPLIVPDVGGQRLADAKTTVDGMQQMAKDLAASRPDTIVFITPHGNVFADGISGLSETELYGDFSDFGVLRKGTSYHNDIVLLNAIGQQAAERDIGFIAIDRAVAQKHNLKSNLDHGILVPLHYLGEAGMTDIPIVALSYGLLPTFDLYRFGTIISKSADALGRRIAVVASGDMSHRLKDEGPYSYHPDGPVFDGTIKDLLGRGDTRAVLALPEKLRENAGECGYRSIVIMLGTLDGLQYTGKIYGYEGPFGVGYLTAGFYPDSPGVSWLDTLEEEGKQVMKERRSAESVPVRWARIVLESYINKDVVPPLPRDMEELTENRAGAFVSLKKKGQLRGCIGTIESAYGNLAEEIAANAVSAGTRDYRFLPVQKEELGDLVYSVDVLGKPQPCRKEDLDPRQYGVIVSRGQKRGLLLPDLEGVDSIEEQVSIALQKAGISPDEDYEIERFEVKRYR